MATVDTVGVKYEADIKNLQAQLDKIIADNARILKQVDTVGNEYSQASNKAAAGLKSVDTQTKQVSKNTAQMQGVVQKAGAAFVAAFATQTIIDFGKRILEVSANFERMEAVLTNTLGSKGAAQAAMREIVEFATKTPFQVAELTDSFVKLANQGFIPTQEEMRKLGDLAASQGKGFDQLTEAIIDAQTGEFERLKEFGIRASKEGNNVTFAFKGVETQTQFTAEAMREYILSLGDVEGVSGGMAAISETLGGKFSNLEDAVMALQRSLGDELNPIMIELIDSFISILDNIDILFAPTKELTNVFSDLFSSFGDLVGTFIDFNGEGPKTEEVFNILAIGIRAAMIPIKLVTGMLNLGIDTFRLLVNEAKKAANFFGAEFEIDLSISVEKLKKDADNIAEAFDLVQEKSEYDGKKMAEGFIKRQQEKDLAREREKKKEEANERERQKAAQLAKKEAEKQAELMLKMALQTQELRIQLMDEGIGKELAKRQLAYEKEKHQLKGNKEALLLIEQKYLQDLEKLQEDELDKELERQLASQANQEDFTQKYQKMQEDELDAEIDRQLAGIEKDNEFNEIKRQNAENNAENRVVIEQATFDTLQNLGNALIKDEQKRASFLKAVALFQIGVNTAEAIAQGVASAQAVPFPGNLIAIATTVAAVAANIANAYQIVNSQSVPGYKTGVIDLQGPGSETSDSIHARLSKGESVMTGPETRAWKAELMAIRNDNFDDLIYQKYVLPALQADRRQRDMASNMVASARLQQMMFDDSRMVATMEKNKPASSKDIQRLDKSIQKAFKDSAYINSKMWKN